MYLLTGWNRNVENTSAHWRQLHLLIRSKSLLKQKQPLAIYARFWQYQLNSSLTEETDKNDQNNAIWTRKPVSDVTPLNAIASQDKWKQKQSFQRSAWLVNLIGYSLEVETKQQPIGTSTEPLCYVISPWNSPGLSLTILSQRRLLTLDSYGTGETNQSPSVLLPSNVFP